MPAPTYSALGERLYQLLCTEIKPPLWTSSDAGRLRVGKAQFVASSQGKVHVELAEQSREQDVIMTATLTEADHARLAPLIRKGAQMVTDDVNVGRVNESLTGIALGPARDPVRAKLTADAVAMAKLILKAAESDSVGETEVRQFMDKIMEDLG